MPVVMNLGSGIVARFLLSEREREEGTLLASMKSWKQTNVSTHI